MCVDVQHFTAQEKSRKETALQGGRVNLADSDAAACDDRFSDRTAAGYMQGDMLKGFLQLLAFCFGDGGACPVTADACDLRKKCGETLRKEIFEDMCKCTPGRGVKLTLQTCIELLRCQRGLQIQENLTVGSVLRQMTAHGQNNRAGNSEMREEHFSHFLPEDFLSAGCTDLHIFQGKPLEVSGPDLTGLKRGQTGKRRLHGMTDGLRHAIAVSR